MYSGGKTMCYNLNTFHRLDNVHKLFERHNARASMPNYKILSHCTAVKTSIHR